MAIPRTLIIAGAGIGGLTAALALTRIGYRVIILEREARLEEAGAGIQLSPNASRILIDLGLETALSATAITPDAISLASARSGGEIARIPFGLDARSRYGAPYWLMRRAYLQNSLLSKVAENREIELRLGCQFEDVINTADGVTVTQRRGVSRQQETASALIGADGVWSVVRQQVFPKARAGFSSRIAWRGTIEPARLPRGFNMQRVQVWMGPDAHLVAYPMAATQQINIVAIVSGQWSRPGWSEPGEIAEIGQHFNESWPEDARLLVDAVESWRKWALFAMPDGGVFAKDNIALLGDAAHAMLPFVAQGAAMAIEDAAVLTNCIKGSPDNLLAAFTRYQHLRAPRVGQVQRAAHHAGQIYHMKGLGAFARDQAIRLRGGLSLRSRHDWIYDWHA